MTQVDLSQLAIDRTESAGNLRARRNLVSRYLLPGLLIFGFVALVAWAAWDLVFPPREVSVIPILVSQSVVQSEGTSLFNAAGWIEPRPTAIRVSALAKGVVETLLVVEDQEVKTGEPVAMLVDEDARLSLDRCIADRQLAEAELKRDRAALAAAKTRFEQPVHLEAMLAEADAALAKINTELTNLPFQTQRAESALNFADRDYQRNLGAAKSLSKREIDQSLTDLETTRAMVKELKDRQSSLQSEQTAITQRRQALNMQLQLLADEIEARDRAEAQVLAGEARVQQMTVAQDEAQLRLDRMTIRAPVDGRVYQLVGLPGARVGDGVMTAMDGHVGGTVVTMYRPDSLQIRVDVRFEDIPKVSLGQPVAINNPALPEPIVGRVLFVSSEADIQKNTLQVKVGVDEAPDCFKPEMLVDVTFLAPKQLQSAEAETQEQLRLYLSQKYVVQHEGNPTVWVADQSAGVARRKTVVTGKSVSGGLIEIMEGLNVSSRVISSGIDNLKNGTRIKVTSEGD